MTEKERRKQPSQRGRRISIATGSLPLGLIINWMLGEYAGVKDMPEDVKLAIVSLAGGMVTVLALCFSDIRSILLQRFKVRRFGDNDSN